MNPGRERTHIRKIPLLREYLSPPFSLPQRLAMFYEEHVFNMMMIAPVGPLLFAGGSYFNQNELAIIGMGIMGSLFATVTVTGFNYGICGLETINQYWQYIDSKSPPDRL